MAEVQTINTLQQEKVILVVDDEPNVLRVCERHLGKEGYTVLTTQDTKRALALLSRGHIHLMLVDIRMPEIDGFQLMNMARRYQPEIAVVMITGYGTVETAVEALHKGAEGLILKPFTGPALIEEVRQALETNREKREYIRLQALRPLFDATGMLFTETDPKRLRGRILDAFLEQMHCGEAGFFWQKSLQTDLELVEVRGECLPRIDYNRYGGLIERLWVRKTPLLASLGALAETGYLDGREQAELEEIFHLYSLRSILCVPVTHKNGGSLLVVARSINQPAFQAADLDLFTILARQATLALENAYLYEELRASIKQLEKSQHVLIQAEKMAAAGRLTASIAHEVNNPLQSVSNCLHLASRPELSDEERKNYIEVAQSELDRLMSIVQQVLALYRPGARNRQPVDVDDVIQHVLVLLDQQFKLGRVKVHANLKAHPGKVMAVRNNIQQVMLNLFLNAIESMPDGGELFIETYRLESEMVIIIEDTGPGIPESEREAVFEPFVSTKETGTGLGLTVSYGIITAYGGTLDIIKGRGDGACFRILLPLGETK